MDPERKADDQDRGSIVVRIIEEKHEKVGAEAIAYARATSEASSVSRSSKAVGNAETVAGIASNMGNVSDSLSGVVSKLYCLVMVVDQVAKVRLPFF